MLLTIRMTPRANPQAVEALAKALSVRAGDWRHLSVSAPSDGTSEIRIDASNRRTATRIVDTFRESIDDLRRSPLAGGALPPTKLNVEASGDTVTLRYQGSLQELMVGLSRLREKPRHESHP